MPFQNPEKEEARVCFLFAAYLMTLSNVRMLSLMHLFLIKPDRPSDISSGRTVLTRFAMAFDAIL